ncbi:phage/plasmid primase, P4 family [Limosilactobacillus vaginalis]|uniref:phage/plasmid primase, P4 family n=1 Tax=Limosilactobacillus vaginalis TaxID=1633 RepID=UPI0022E0B019|nr:phage/plasmid primase, P4 family [Limosilactobacillus vaginalis]
MDYSGVPQELKELPNWGLFRKEWDARKGKYNKYPLNAETGELAKSNDPSTWTSFDNALGKISEYGAAGLAFFIQPPYMLIDLDHCFEDIQRVKESDHDNQVADFIDRTMSYTELSVSGEGIHIIVKGNFPGPKRRHGNVEMYPEERFVALTGNVFGKPVNAINTASDENLQYLYNTYLDKQGKVIPLSEDTAGPLEPSTLTADQVIEKALASAQGPKFKKFMDGDWQDMGYTSHSDADQGFANILAFWCAKDKSLMDEVFRQSGMYRPKWDEKRGKGTYADLTLNEAINKTPNVYQPKSSFHITIKDQSSTIKKLDPMLKDMSWTDTGLRNRFLQKHLHDVKYSAERERFLYFDGHKWSYDQTDMINRMLDPVINDIQKEPLEAPEDKDEERISNARSAWIRKCKNHATKSAALKEIASYVKVTDDTFDSQTGVINTPDGIVNLASGDVQPTTYKDMVTKMTNAGTGEYATPIFDKFMQQIFPGHPELISFVLRLMGYSMLGTISEQIIIMLFGQGGQSNGANGKSVLVELYRQIMNDYAVTIDPEVVTYQRSKMRDSNQDSQLANTKGSRVIVTSELERGAKLSEAIIKRLTGGETITARRLYERPIQFKPTGTLWMTTNYLPTVKGTDNGIWRRIITVPMTAHITKKDPHLLDKLMTERDGILHKIIEGALEYQKHGLQIPQIVNDFRQAYQEDMDTVGQFLEDMMIVTNEKKDRVTNEQLYGIYDQWNRSYQLLLSHQGLSKELTQRGFERWRSRTGRGLCGMKPKQIGIDTSNIPDIDNTK